VGGGHIVREQRTIYNLYKSMEINNNKTIHFIGIGGSGMCPLAKILLQDGYAVTGSDLKENLNTIILKDFGAKIFLGHKPSNLREADVVVASSAISKTNIEYSNAIQDKTVLKRAEMLDFAMQSYEKRIAIAGTHGKTTTTAMISRVLELSNKNPSYIIGAEMQDYGSNAALGHKEFFVTEADESDGSFLYLKPNIAVITNLEAEHMDYYKNLENLLDHFKKFLKITLEQKGHLIINKDDTNLTKICSKLPKDKVHYYSIEEPSNVMASNITHSANGAHFNLIINGKDEGEIHLRVFGKHNIYNALATICFGLHANISIEQIKKALFSFMGTKRRFQLITNTNDITIYDDYAHHPTEIAVTLDGIKKSFPEKRIICIFQPHRYTRTLDLIDKFPDAFKQADIAIITEIFAANEKQIDGISGKLIVDKMTTSTPPSALFFSKKSEVAPYLFPLLKKDDVVVTMGAGNITSVARELHARLNTSKPKQD
jgi:UDP-N-acetylmuramate--alanine ligase